MVVCDRPVKAELINRMRDSLERDLRTNVPTTDPSRASRVVIGKDVGDPNGVIISVHETHPLGVEAASQRDASVERLAAGSEQKAWQLPVESIGGSKFRRVAGTVQIRCLVETNQAEIVTIVETVIARTISTLTNDPTLRGFADAFGYNLFALQAEDAFGYASGGDEVASDRFWVNWFAFVSFRRSEL